MTSTLIEPATDELPIYSLALHSGRDSRDRFLAVYRARTAPEARHLVSTIFDSRRRRLLVVVVADPRQPVRVTPSAIAAEVADHADVVVLDPSLTSSTLDEELPQWLRPSHEVVRVFLPGADISDDRARHPGIALDRTRPIAWNTTQVIRTTRTHGEKLERQNRNAGSGDELATERADHATTKRNLKAANDRVRALKSSNDSLASALDELRRSVFADPELQFQHDLWLAWLRATEEGDRTTWPLRDWILSAEFIASIDAQQIVDRDRVLRACVDVVTGRHAEIKSRASHRLRRSDAATSGHRQRASDDATAWSCSINVGPAAARLRWWERVDGVIELSLVTDHDDVRLSE